MTDLSDRLKALQEAMTRGEWSVYRDRGQRRTRIIDVNGNGVAVICALVHQEGNATVIALGDLFIPLAMELLMARCPVSYLGAPTTEECIAADQCGCSRGALLAQIAERLTGASQ